MHQPAIRDYPFNKRFVFLVVALMVFSGPSMIRAFQPRTCSKKPLRQFFHSSSRCYLNRFLFDAAEVDSSATPPRVIISKDDYRTVHAAKILGLENGDKLRAGVVSCDEQEGLWTDGATVEWIPEGKVKKAAVLKNGNPPGSLEVTLDDLKLSDKEAQDIPVSLLLALPRPLQLGRMLPMISQLGVDQLILTGSKKVHKDYFGSHLLRKPEVLRERLIEGLCQAGDVRLPKVTVVRNLRKFLQEDIDTLFPPDTHARVIAHPQRVTDTSEPLRMGDVEFPSSSLPPRVVVAVGPEGGWEEPDELKLFQELGFQQITLGTRTLRSDCAVVSLMSLANEVCQQRR